MKDFLVAIIGTLFAAVIVHESKAWRPRFIAWIVEVAVRRLPRVKRDRFREEWAAHILETPGTLKKIWDASGFWLGASRMFPALQSRLRSWKRFRRAQILIRVLDVYLTAFGLVVLAPVLLFIALVLARTGPPIVRRANAGVGGRKFDSYRFRTVPVVPGEPYAPNYVDRILIITGLDALPQLFNVLKGDMSLIGRRPLPPMLLRPDPQNANRMLGYRPQVDARPGLFTPAEHLMTRTGKLRSVRDYVRALQSAVTFALSAPDRL